MTDIPVASPTPPPTTAANAAAASGLTAVQVSVTQVPSALENLTRTIQTTATPVVVSNANSLTLATTLGSITVALSQQLSAAEKQNLTQQLMSLVQSGRSVTLTLQPGSPPTQGALLIPQTTASAPVQIVQEHSFLSASVLSARPLAVGDDFRAIVLPPLPAPAAVLASAPQAASLINLAALRPLNPAPEAENVLTAMISPPPVGELPVTEHPQTANAFQETIVSSDPQTATPPANQALPSQQADIVRQTSVPPPAQAANAYQFMGAPAAPQTPAAIQQTISQSAPQMPPSAPPPANPVPLPQQADVLQQTPAPQTANVLRQTGAAPAPQPATPALNSAPSLPPDDDAAPSFASTANAIPKAVSPASSNPVAPQATSLLIPGNEVSLRVVSVFVPRGSAPEASIFAQEAQASPPLAPNQIVATVSGAGTGGQLILKAGDATLFVKAQVSAPVGANLIVSIDPIKSSPLMTLPPLETPNFQALPQILATLQQIDPAIFQNLMSSFLPQPTDALPGALLFLLSAFKQGNVRGWLGNDAVDSLISAGKSSIIGSLSKELSGAGQPAQDSVVGEWRSYPLPLYAHQQFQALTLYVHGDRDPRKGESANAPGFGRMRFLIDMRLSRLGAMQVDGFVQPKKLDMILRSETVLPAGLPHDLRAAYLKALNATGFAGTLNFQVGRQHWMVIQRTEDRGQMTEKKFL